MSLAACAWLGPPGPRADSCRGIGEVCGERETCTDPRITIAVLEELGGRGRRGLRRRGEHANQKRQRSPQRDRSQGCGRAMALAEHIPNCG